MFVIRLDAYSKGLVLTDYMPKEKGLNFIRVLIMKTFRNERGRILSARKDLCQIFWFHDVHPATSDTADTLHNVLIVHSWIVK